jgi:hypothetical protein
VQQARDVFVQLVKGLKGIGLFRHNANRFPGFLEPAHRLLTTYLAAHGRLPVEVGPEAFLLQEQSLMPAGADQQLPFRFHRAGIRRLIFMPGVTLEELVKLSLVALGDVDPRRRNDDVVSALWAASLTHIQHVSVEGFTVGELQEDQVEVEVAAVMGDLERRAQAQQLVLNVAGESTAPSNVPPGFAKRVQADLAQDRAGLLPKLVGVIFAVLEAELSENAQGLGEVLLDVVDGMLAQGDFTAINHLLIELPAKSSSPALVALLTALAGKLGEPKRLTVVLDVLRAKAPEAPAEALRYLTSLPMATAPVFLEALDTIEPPESRQVICETLAALSSDPAPFVARLEGSTPAMVRDMLFVLDKIDAPDKIKLFAGAFRSPNPDVRLAVLEAVVGAHAQGARAMLSQALVDPEVGLRTRAARALIELDPASGFQELSRLLRSPDFAKRSQEEQIAVYAAIGASGQPEAETLLARAFMQDSGGLLQRKRVARERLLALAGLSECGTIGVYRLLQEAVQKGIGDPELLAATRRAVATLHGRLSGKAPPAAGSSG